MLDIRVKRIYQAVDPGDGVRVLVDRVWPRGMTHEQARLDLWLREAAPSTVLRQWFGHERAKWEEFRQRYYAELDTRPVVVAALLEQAAGGPVTLLFSAKETECNQAVALREYLLARAAAPPPGKN